MQDTHDNCYPLSGLRIVDCSSGIPGAYCSKVLADAGADVIKVECPAGDPLRQWTVCEVISGESPLDEGDDGALFKYLHNSKRSVVLDFNIEEQRKKALALAASSDFVIENFSVAQRQAYGLNLDALGGKCSLVSITPFGTSGPWADMPATEFTLQGWSGSMNARGCHQNKPLSVGGRTGEWIAGAFAALSILSAWQRISRTGRAEHLDVSLFESIVLTHTAWQPLGFSMKHPWASLPARVVDIPAVELAKDGYAGFTCRLGQQWHDFSRLVGHPEWIEDQSLLSFFERSRRKDELHVHIDAWLKDKTVEEAVEIANLMRIPAVPVLNGATIPKNRHIVERGVLVKNPRGGFLQPRPPFLMSDAIYRPFGPAPRLGEHQADIKRIEDAFVASTAHRTANKKHDISGEKTAELPLQGMLAVDFTQAWAGSFAAQILSMLGADVIKIERHQKPDNARFSSTDFSMDQWWNRGWLFMGPNAGKRAITLDMTKPEGLEIAKDLIRHADFVLENFSPRVIESFGLDWDAVHALNPRVIMLRMPAFGLSGPWRDNVGFAESAEMASGMAWVTGHPDAPPVSPRGPCDPLSGLHGILGVLTALEQRKRTGKGMMVESTMLDAALNITAEAIVEHSAYGFLIERMGNRGPTAALQNVYACFGQDQWVAIAVENDEQWAGLREVLHNPGWTCDHSLDTVHGRRNAHDLIDQELVKWCAGQTPESITERLLAQGVPAAVVTREWLVDKNPQLSYRGFYETLEHPLVGQHANYVSLPFSSSEGPDKWLRHAPPMLGQHNHEVFCGLLGYSEEKYQSLWNREVIGDKPNF